MKMLQSAIDSSQENVTGTARLKLYKETVSWLAENPCVFIQTGDRYV